MIGETLNGKYRIVRLMGGGGMGAVYEATVIESSARVAIKVIHTGDLAKDKTLIGRFQREAQATSAIDTEHIVRVIETGQSATTGQPFMVMEYLEGEDLSHVFKRFGPLPPDLALRIIAQACLGLEQAHLARIIHRDIKPANLFLAAQSDGTIRVKLLDFGIAKIKMEQAHITDTKSLTRTGSMIGSPLYMSPEQARGSKSIDHRADIWSLGVVFYQALSGRTPNQDIDALGELIIAICSEPATHIQQFAPWVPPEIAAIVHQTLHFDPDERFKNASEMFAAIERLLPQGSTLRPEQLIGVEPEQRAKVAPILDLPRSNPPPRLVSSGSGSRRITTGGSVRTISRTGTIDPALTSSFFGAELPEGGTPLGLANSPFPSTRAAPPRRTPLFMGGAVALGIGLGVGVYKLLTPGAPLPAALNPTAAPGAAPETSTAPAARAPSAAPGGADRAPEERTVKVVIVPGDAKVEVDGAKVQAKGGAIEIAGSLGSVHRVRVARGVAQASEDVVITEGGAMPPRIELDQGAAPSRPRSTVARPTATATATATPTSTGTSTFKDKFE